MLEVLHSHTNVLTQPGFDSPYFGGINPYALGFAMYRDIRRICEDPTDEDRPGSPTSLARDWLKTLDFAMRNFKDESFIRQFLSPKVIRDFHLFCLIDDDQQPHLEDRRDPRRRRAIARCATLWRVSTHSASASRTSRSCTWT